MNSARFPPEHPATHSTQLVRKRVSKAKIGTSFVISVLENRLDGSRIIVSQGMPAPVFVNRIGLNRVGLLTTGESMRHSLNYRVCCHPSDAGCHSGLRDHCHRCDLTSPIPFLRATLGHRPRDIRGFQEKLFYLLHHAGKVSVRLMSCYGRSMSIPFIPFATIPSTRTTRRSG
jgi:hypothetical protein